MAEEVKVLQLGTHEYAAEVHEAGETTEHRVLLTQEMLDSLGVSDEDEHRFVAESMKYLLQETPVTALPHDIDLVSVAENEEFLPEMRSRMSG